MYFYISVRRHFVLAVMLIKKMIAESPDISF